MTGRITELDKQIAKRVRSLREERRMTQPTVAGALGITYQSYQKVEGGRVSFRASTLQKLAALFGVPVQQLFGDALAEGVSNAETLAHISAILMKSSPAEAEEIMQCAVRRGK